jgi:mRNA interferase RelE/StbE
MRYRLFYLPGAEKDVRALPAGVAERVRRAVERLGEDPRLGKRLSGELAPWWSYRVGDYRIVYEVRNDELVVLVVMVGHRRAIYERARRRTR